MWVIERWTEVHTPVQLVVVMHHQIWLPTAIKSLKKKKKPEGGEITRNKLGLPIYLWINCRSRGPYAFQVNNNPMFIAQDKLAS